MVKISSLPQYRRNVKRFTEIVTVLGRYRLAEFVGRNDPEFVQNLFKSAGGERLFDLTEAERIRLALTELGTTFIKLGQILSTRADVVGAEVAGELSRLQSDTPSDPPDVVRATVAAELGQPVKEVFASFDDEAIASASIGQVHRARLHDGTNVVVKVQHAGIEETIVQDMDIFEALAAMAERHDEVLAQYQLGAAAAEFRRTLLRELDFNREARNIETIGRNFADDDGVRVPEVRRDCSSRRVLTMERLDGIGVGDTERLAAERVDTRALAIKGANVFLDMMFRDGIYHADPHPGNLLVLQGSVLGLLDFGMVGRVDGLLRDSLESAILAIIERDSEEVMRNVLRLGTTPPGLDRTALQGDIEDFVAEYAAGELARLDLSRALTDLTEIIRRHRILLTGNVSMLLRMLVVLEGTSRTLDRAFSLAEVIQPYTIKITQRRFGPKRLLSEARRRLRDWERLLSQAPLELSEILTRIRDGKFDVNLRHRDLDASINRLALGILTAALFLGSTTLWANQVPPLIGGVSVVGVTGSVVAVLLGIRLLRAMRAL